MLSHSVREAAVAIYGFLSLSNTHTYLPSGIRNKPGHEFNHKAPHRFYTSKYVDRHHQQSFPNMSDNFFHKLMFRVEEEKAQFFTL